MQHLSGLDNLFLTMEDNRQHMHVAALGIYDPSTAPGSTVRFKTVLDFFSSKINEMPFFRRRLVKAPFLIDRPHWVEDGEVDVEYHVRHLALPEPGDWRQLMIQVARIHARPLDTTRPLWEVYVIGGLDNIKGIAKGSFALYIKMHHAGVDGQTGAKLIQVLHTMTPDYDASPKTGVVYADREPSKLELSLRGVVNRGRQIADAASLTFEVGKKAVDLGEKYGSEAVESAQRLVLQTLRLADGESNSKSKAQQSMTRFDNPVSPHRVVDAFGLSMADCKTIRENVSGVTVNDIFMAAVGGGLRKYLGQHRELPEVTLNAMMPLAAEVGDRQSSNNISMASVPIYTNIEDPVERLFEVKKGSAKGKELQEDVGRDLFAKLLDVIPTAIAKKITVSTLNKASLTISNVRGPDIPLYLAGAKMEMFMPVSIPFDGVGINVTGFSYAGTLWVCMTACREMVPDPGFLSKCMQESFDELVKASVVWAKKTKVQTPKSPAKVAPKQKKIAPAKAAVKKAVARKKK